MMKGKVSIVKTNDSYEGTLKALEQIKDEILEKGKSKNKFIIKPNFVSTSRYLSATPKPTVDAILKFVYDNFSPSEVMIAESPAGSSAEVGFRNYGYYELRNKYPGVEFYDLDELQHAYITLEDENGGTFEVTVPKVLLDRSFFLISPCRAKTHYTVIVTLSIKNIVMGSISRGYKASMHRGYYTINYNIAKMITMMMPDLGIVDGVEGMEGNGPVGGSPKKWGVIMASTNVVNLDVAAAYGMGFNPEDVGYLFFLAKWGYGEIDPLKIPTIGEKIESIRTKFKPHSSYKYQLAWKERLNKQVFNR